MVIRKLLLSHPQILGTVFLAVASLIAAAVLIVRAYRVVVGDDTPLPEDIDELIESATGIKDRSNIADIAEPAVSMSSISVLHTGTLKPVAIDLEVAIC